MEMEVAGSSSESFQAWEMKRKVVEEKDQVRVTGKTLQAVLEQCQRAIELISNSEGGINDEDGEDEADVDPQGRVSSVGLQRDQEVDELHINVNCQSTLFCYQHQESAEHILFFCPFAQATWKASAFNYSPAALGFPGFPKWWFQLCHDRKMGMTKEGLAHIAFILWNLWKARNALVFEGRRESPWDVWLRADRGFMEFQQANKIESSEKLNEEPENAKWIPPPSGVIKINCDAAFDQNSGKASIAAVFRDNSSFFVHGVTAPCWAPSAAAAEAFAMKLGLTTASHLAFSKVIIETDNKAVVNRLKTGVPSDWTTSATEECIKSLAKEFESCCFSFVSRSCNQLADWLAKFAKTEQVQVCWSPRVLPSHLLYS